MYLKSIFSTVLLCLSANSYSHTVPASPPVKSMAETLEAFNWSFDDVDIKTEQVSDGFYVLFGLGGNIAVSSGKDGVLIVDDQFPELMPKLRNAMRKQGDDEVDFVVNTHWHFDHADGNKALGKDSWIVSHSNSRRMMLRDNVINLVGVAGLQKAYPEEALPDITYDERMQFHINGEQVDLLHAGPAHTTGDTAVIFRGRNAVHMGDVYNNAGYPFIDAGNGGTLDGVITFCKAVLEEIDDDTTVIPGHGPLATKAQLAAYVLMLETVHAEMLTMIKQGKTFDEISAAGLTATWDTALGNPGMFLNRSYISLTNRYIE